LHGVLRVLPICNPLPFCLLPCNPLPCTPLPCNPLTVFLSTVVGVKNINFCFRRLCESSSLLDSSSAGGRADAPRPLLSLLLLLSFPPARYCSFPCWFIPIFTGVKNALFGFCRCWAGTASDILVGGRPYDPRPRPPPRPRLTHQLPRPAPAFGDFITSTTPSSFGSYGLTGAGWSGSSS
jgi:hypothetical protein